MLAFNFLLCICGSSREGLNCMLDGFPTRAAWAYSAGLGTEPVLFEGYIEGRIVPPRGWHNLDFGWGPVFETDDTGLTYVRALMLLLRSPWAWARCGVSCGDSDADNFAGTRRWRRHRKCHRAHTLEKMRMY
jgi:hypothetical protein